MLDRKLYDIDNAASCLTTDRAKVILRQLSRIYPDMSIFWDVAREEVFLEDDDVIITISGNM